MLFPPTPSTLTHRAAALVTKSASTQVVCKAFGTSPFLQQVDNNINQETNQASTREESWPALFELVLDTSQLC